MTSRWDPPPDWPVRHKAGKAAHESPPLCTMKRSSALLLAALAVLCTCGECTGRGFRHIREAGAGGTGGTSETRDPGTGPAATDAHLPRHPDPLPSQSVNMGSDPGVLADPSPQAPLPQPQTKPNWPQPQPT